MFFHSLTLAATAEMKRVEENWHQGGSIKCPGACSGDVYFSQLDHRFTFRNHRASLMTEKEPRPIAAAGIAVSGLKECQQIGVELILVRVRKAVGCARVDL